LTFEREGSTAVLCQPSAAVRRPQSGAFFGRRPLPRLVAGLADPVPSPATFFGGIKTAVLSAAVKGKEGWQSF
jgi:hypothetical protein